MARESHSLTLTGWPESLERKMKATICEVVGPLELELLSDTKEAGDTLSTPSTTSPFKYFLDTIGSFPPPDPPFPSTYPDYILSYDVSQIQYFLFGGRLLVQFVPPPTPPLIRIIRRLAEYNPRDYVFTSFSSNYRIDGRVHHDSGSVGPYYGQEDLRGVALHLSKKNFQIILTRLRMTMYPAVFSAWITLLPRSYIGLRCTDALSMLVLYCCGA